MLVDGNPLVDRDDMKLPTPEMAISPVPACERINPYARSIAGSHSVHQTV